MANYNIQMQYFNGESYDLLYPEIEKPQISLYDTIEKVGTYNVQCTMTSRPGQVYVGDIFSGFEEYDGLFFDINYKSTGYSNNLQFYLLEMDNFSIVPLLVTNNTIYNLKVRKEVKGCRINGDNEIDFIFNSEAKVLNGMDFIASGEIKTQNGLSYFQNLNTSASAGGNSILRIRGAYSNNGQGIICEAEVTIYKYKYNINI